MPIQSNMTNKKALSVSKLETDGKYLTFWTDNQLFGVPIADVVQIVGIQKITAIPEFPEYAKGVINLRGEIIPVIDVRLRFHKQEAAYDERTCVIVTNIGGEGIGFIVDAVDAVINIDDEAISQPPQLARGAEGSSFLTGVARLENNVALLLNTQKILSENAVMMLTQGR